MSSESDVSALNDISKAPNNFRGGIFFPLSKYTNTLLHMPRYSTYRDYCGVDIMECIYREFLFQCQIMV